MAVIFIHLKRLSDHSLHLYIFTIIYLLHDIPKFKFFHHVAILNVMQQIHKEIET